MMSSIDFILTSKRFDEPLLMKPFLILNNQDLIKINKSLFTSIAHKNYLAISA